MLAMAVLYERGEKGLIDAAQAIINHSVFVSEVISTSSIIFIVIISFRSFMVGWMQRCGDLFGCACGRLGLVVTCACGSTCDGCVCARGGHFFPRLLRCVAPSPCDLLPVWQCRAVAGAMESRSVYHHVASASFVRCLCVHLSPSARAMHGVDECVLLPSSLVTVGTGSAMACSNRLAA